MKYSKVNSNHDIATQKEKSKMCLLHLELIHCPLKLKASVLPMSSAEPFLNFFILCSNISKRQNLFWINFFLQEECFEALESISRKINTNDADMRSHVILSMIKVKKTKLMCIKSISFDLVTKKVGKPGPGIVSIIYRVLYVFFVSDWHACSKFITGYY